MADVTNPAFVGLEKLGKIDNVEHIKHAISISKYAPVSPLFSVTQSNAKHFLALDIETDVRRDSLTRDRAMLIGVVDWDPRQINRTEKERVPYGYAYREEDGVEGMLFFLVSLLDHAVKYGKSFVYWSKFDGIHLFKLMLEHNGYKEEEVVTSCERYQKSVKGLYKKGDADWNVQPVVSCKLLYKEEQIEFGIRFAVADCLCLFFWPERRKKQGLPPFYVWAYDGSKHWFNGLATEAKNNGIKEYKKGEEYTHVVDWSLFKEGYKFGPENAFAEKQKNAYVRSVLVSNYMDCFAAKKLQEIAQANFFKSFGIYPKTMLTAGSLANVAIGKLLETDIEKNKSLNFYNQLADWELSGVSLEDMKTVYNLAIDSYSAGMIDILRIGFVENVAFADVTGSYPSAIRTLLDLKGSKVTTGKNCSWDEVPVPTATRYVFLSAQVNVYTETIHTLSVKAENLHDDEEPEKWEDKRGNIRPYGTFIASGLYEEFELVRKQQMKPVSRRLRNAIDDPVDEVLEWVCIETTGAPSPLVQIIDELFAKRKEYLEQKSNTEQAVKAIMASVYGKTFECIRQYEEVEGDVTFVGHRAGQYFNPVLACIITAFARIRLAEAAVEVVRNGGKPMVFMTDALYWEGTTDQLPSSFDSILAHRRGYEKGGWSEEKTLGLFDKPRQFSHGLFLKPGFYEYYDPEKKAYQVKAMGYYINRPKSQQHLPYLRTKLQLAVELGYYNEFKSSEYFLMESKEIITPGEVFESYKRQEEGKVRTGKRSVYDLGRLLVSESQEVYMSDIYPKRELFEVLQFEKIIHEVIDTTPPFSGLFHRNALEAMYNRLYYDARLLPMRELLNEQHVELTKSVKPQLGWNEQIKTLAKQLGITQKAGRKLGLEAMRSQLIANGIKPLA